MLIKLLRLYNHLLTEVVPYFLQDIFYNQQTTGSLSYTSYTTSSAYSYNVFRTNQFACRKYGNYATPYQKGVGNTGTTFRACSAVTTGTTYQNTC